MIARLRRLRAHVLGLNRRNHEFLFVHNPRDRYALVDDKRATKRVLAAHGVPAPALHHVCDTQSGVRRLGEHLEAATDFVLKPARGAGGAGIVVIVGRAAAGFVKASGVVLGRADLESHACDVIAGAYSARGAGDVLLVEERVVAEATLGALAHRGVPDVRVLVFQGVPVLAMLRLPTRRSDGRANLHLGGVGVGLDLARGETAGGVVYGRLITTHPDTGRALAGTRVPAWSELLLLAARAAEAVGLGFVGVDLVLDAGRGPLVLEVNARPGLAIQVANRCGLRPRLAAVVAAGIPDSAAGRVALGQRLAASLEAGAGS